MDRMPWWRLRETGVVGFEDSMMDAGVPDALDQSLSGTAVLAPEKFATEKEATPYGLTRCLCPICCGSVVEGQGATIGLDPNTSPQAAPPVFTLDQIINNFVSRGGRWATNTVTYGFPSAYPAGYGVETNGFTPFNAAQQAAAERALQLWSDVANITFVRAPNENTAQIRFGYSSTMDGYAYAYFPSSSDYGGDIWFNSTYSNLTTGSQTLGNYGFLTFLHEIGHAIGLPHPGSYNGGSPTYDADGAYTQDTHQYTVMSYFDARNTGGNYNGAFPVTPMLHDIAAIQRIYGTNTTTRSGNTTYGFNNNTGQSVYDFSQNNRPVFAIWDTGGTDTIDASGFSQSQRIDLRAGEYSNVGGLTGNITIAYNSVVENAIGGAGFDVLIGNTAANTLTGGGGDDELNGGQGNDTLDGGAGSDTILLSGARSSYTILFTGGTSYTVSGSDGSDTVTNVEFVRFTNETSGSVLLSSVATANGSIVSVSDTSIVEGDNGSQQLVFTLTLSTAATSNFTIPVTFGASGTAILNVDFTAPSTSINFISGATTATFTVNISGDTEVEADELIYLQLGTPSVSNILIGSRSFAIGTIFNNDVPGPDEFTATNGTTGVLPVGGNTAGGLQSVGDRDWLRLDVVAGASYLIDLEGISTLGNGGLRDPLVRIVTATGAELASADTGGTGTNARLLFTATQTGPVYVEIRSSDDRGTGSYLVRASAGQPSLTFSQAAVAEGSSLRITAELSAATTADVTFTVAARSGTAIVGTDLGAFSQSVTIAAGSRTATLVINTTQDTNPESDETFFLDVSNLNNALLDPRFGSLAQYIVNDDAAMPDSVGNSTGAALAISAGSTINNTLEVGSDTDWFSVTLTAGNSYTISLASRTGVANPLRDPLLEVRNSSGALIRSIDNVDSLLNAQLNLPVSTTGTYYIVARSSNENSSGDYTLRVGTGSASDDFSGDVSTTGTVSSANGSTTTGGINSLGDRDWFRVSLSAGTTYSFYLEGANATAGTLTDPYLYLYGSSGALINQNDDGAGNLNSLITFTPTSSGNYFLGASAYNDGSTGTYRLRVSTSNVGVTDDHGSSTVTASTISAGGTATGNINFGGDQDWFRITLTAGTPYVFQLNASSSPALGDPFLRVLNSAGTVLASNDDSNNSLNSLISFTPTSTGTYFLSAEGLGSATGRYTLVAGVSDNTSAGATQIRDGANITGSVETVADLDYYVLDLIAGQTYTLGVTATSGNLDTILSLRDSSNTSIADNDDITPPSPGIPGNTNSLITYTAVRTGRYYLVVGPYLSTTGNYRLNVTSTATDRLRNLDPLHYLASNPDLIAAFGANTALATEHYLNAGIAEGRRTNSFDAYLYLASNRDLAILFDADTNSAIRHYVTSGYTEGRPTNSFDPRQYLAVNPSLIPSYGSSLQGATLHFITSGARQGLATSGFDPLIYAASHPDLAQAFGTNAEAAFNHFLNVGYNEGRTQGTFDPLVYAATHRDLALAFGNNRTLALNHYLLNGAREGRVTTGFDALTYAATHRDLALAFGNDTARALNHYLVAGAREGRATVGFNAQIYAASHQDLALAFGDDVAAATNHYLTAGLREGRAVSGFDPLIYAATNPDIALAYGNNASQSLSHYLAVGAREGRRISGFNPLIYAASHTDLALAFGNDSARALNHYLLYGVREGRVTSGFDPLIYAASHTDLALAFGNDAARALNHYLLYGVREGRVTSGFDPRAYLINNPDVGAAGYTEATAIGHYLIAGAPEGRLMEGLFGREQGIRSITAGESLNDEINNPSDNDLFSVNLSSTDQRTITLQSTAGTAFDASITLYNRHGQVVTTSFSNSPTASLVVNQVSPLPYSGTYYIGISSNNSGYTGAYQLSVSGN
jgi:hypothetical protein